MAELHFGIESLATGDASDEVVGKFQALLALRHANICQYIDCLRGRYGLFASISNYTDFIRTSFCGVRILPIDYL